MSNLSKSVQKSKDTNVMDLFNEDEQENVLQKLINERNDSERIESMDDSLLKVQKEIKNLYKAAEEVKLSAKERSNSEFSASAPFVIGSLVSVSLMATYVATGLFELFSSSYLFSMLAIMGAISPAIVGAFFIINSEENKNKKQWYVEELIRQGVNMREELLKFTFEGEISGYTLPLDSAWQDIKVQENGKIEEYMIRVQTDAKTEFEYIEKRNMTTT